MADSSTDGQGPLRVLARAHQTLVEEGRLVTEGLLPAWRALRPAAHPGAGRDEVDVEFVGRVLARYGADCLRAARFSVHPAHARSDVRLLGQEDASSTVRVAAPPLASALGEVLALALGLSLEAAKIRHGLPAPPGLLRQTFASPADARAALDAIAAGGVAREVEVPTSGASPGSTDVDVPLLRDLCAERPVYVVAGRCARRVHDLLSPWARRLREELVPLGKALGAARDEEPYAALDLIAADADAYEERLLVESADGFLPAGRGVVAVRCEAIPEGDADRRCRETARALKRSRTLLVLVQTGAEMLAHVLAVVGAGCRGVLILDEGNVALTPAFVEDVATGHLAPVDNAWGGDGVLTSVPALGFIPTATRRAMDAHAFGLVTAVLHARAHSGLGAARLAVQAVPAMDHQAASLACMDALARLGPALPARR